jgi:hypothetical protein
MQNSHSSLAGFQMNTTQAMVGAVLVGAGCVVGMAGAIIGGQALISAMGRWFHELDVPPHEVVKHKWSQTKAATHAGAQAWHSANGMHATSAR